MLSFTRKTDYALVALTDIARRSPSPVSARDMSRRLNLPLPALQKILTNLTHKNIVRSIKGAQGGYQLERPATAITLAEVVEAVEGVVRLTLCAPPDAVISPTRCPSRPVCPIRNSIGRVHTLLVQCLTEITIDDLARGTVPPNLAALTPSRG